MIKIELEIRRRKVVITQDTPFIEFARTMVELMDMYPEKQAEIARLFSTIAQLFLEYLALGGEHERG